MFYIYVHKQKDSGEVFYIGKGHGRRAYHKYNRNKFWYNIVHKHDYVIEILYKDLTEDEAYKLEEKLIEELKPKANFAKGGNGGMKGYKFSKERNEKLSKALKGRKNTWASKLPQNRKGYKHKPEFGEKISKSCKGIVRRTGYTLSEETKEKISNSKKGNKNTLGRIMPEHEKQVRSRANLGKKKSLETKEKMKQAALKRWENKT